MTSAELSAAREALTVRVVDKASGASRVLYRPTERQTVFHVSPQRKVLYGGAAGGGKSYAARWDAYLRCLSAKDYRALLLRRTFPELETTHMDAAAMEAPTIGATFVKSDKCVVFPNGSKLVFGHCQDQEAISKHLSSQWDIIYFDEGVTFSLRQFLMIGSRARTPLGMDAEGRVIESEAEVGGLVRVLTNPGKSPVLSLGDDPDWCRTWFIHKTVDRKAYPKYRPEQYAFVPAKLCDNPFMPKAYEDSLNDLPEALRRAYLDGDWDLFEGQFFSEWRAEKHVARLVVPEGCEWVRAVDWGYANPGWCGWFACLGDGRVYVAYEYVFRQTVAAEVAREIRRLTPLVTGNPRVRYTVGDTAMWTPEGQTGESIAETFARAGVPMVQANKDRVNGWARLRHWLKDAPDGKPWLVVSPDCPYLARTLPSLVMDSHKPEDVDSDGEDHACLTGDSVVWTTVGWKPIRLMGLSDVVMTRQGWRGVEAVAVTGRHSVTRVDFSDGSGLIGTDDHPLWVEGRGFVPLSSLRYGDIMLSWQEITTAMLADSGVRPTDPFPAATTSTTGTATSGTTRWAISNAFRRSRTSVATARNTPPIGRGSTAFGLWPPTGTDHRKGASGIANMVVRCGRVVSRSLGRAWSVVADLSAGAFGRATAFAATTASPNGVGTLAWTTRLASATSVEPTSPPTSTAANTPVPASAVRVVGCSPAGIATTYNLTVFGAHEYFANGVLVSNCDAVRYFCMSRPSPTRERAAAYPVGSIGWQHQQDRLRRSRWGMSGYAS